VTKVVRGATYPCPYCRERLKAGDDVVTCANCGLVYHRACVEWAKGLCIRGHPVRRKVQDGRVLAPRPRLEVEPPRPRLIFALALSTITSTALFLPLIVLAPQWVKAIAALAFLVWIIAMGWPRDMLRDFPGGEGLAVILTIAFLGYSFVLLLTVPGLVDLALSFALVMTALFMCTKLLQRSRVR